MAVPTCPAACKLYNPKVGDNNCEIGNILHTGFIDSRGISIAKSPRYGCSDYLRNEVCVYNISMPCKDSHISISKYSSAIDIAEGDSLEIIDYKTHTHYQPITGTDINSITNRHIKTSDFLLLFLSEKDSTQSTGFKLQFECPSIRNEGNEEEEEVEEESGSGFDIDE